MGLIKWIGKLAADLAANSVKKQSSQVRKYKIQHGQENPMPETTGAAVQPAQRYGTKLKRGDTDVRQTD